MYYMTNPHIAQTLPIYKQTYELLTMIVKIRKNFSREYRYDLGSHLFESTLRCLELIQKANTAIPEADYIPQFIGEGSANGLVRLLCCFIEEWRRRRVSRRQYLEDFIVEFGTVKMLIGVSKELGQISINQAAQMAVLTESIGRQATAWKKTAQ
jgi:hypothetical protein